MEDADHGASPTTLEVHDKKQWSTTDQKSMLCRVISLLIFYGHTEGVTPIHKRHFLLQSAQVMFRT